MQDSSVKCIDLTLSRTCYFSVHLYNMEKKKKKKIKKTNKRIKVHFGTWNQVVPVVRLDRRVWNMHRGEAAKIVICCPCQQGVTYIEHVLKAGDLTTALHT